MSSSTARRFHIGQSRLLAAAIVTAAAGLAAAGADGWVALASILDDDR